MSELVSVVIPVYNVEDYLRQCPGLLTCVSIRSWRRRTHLQVIVLEDGSTDSSGVICDQYAQTDECVTVRHQFTSGLSAARNAGVELADGHYLTFVDSDDWLDLTMIETLVSLARQEEADVAMCGYDRGSGTEGEGDPHVVVLSGTEGLRQLLGPKDVYTRMVMNCCKLYRRDLFQGISFPLGRYHEDEFVTHRVIHQARCVVQTDARLYHYRVRAGSITSSSTEAKRKDARDAFAERARFFRRHMSLDDARSAYRRAFFLHVHDRRAIAGLEGGSRALGSLSDETKALVRESRGIQENWRFRLYIEAYAIAPTLVASLLSTSASLAGRVREWRRSAM